jgi:hypothetical protein
MGWARRDGWRGKARIFAQFITMRQFRPWENGRRF